MSGKWTPGPWRVEHMGGRSTVLTNTRPLHNNAASPSYGNGGENGPFCIASVFCDGHGPRLDFVTFSHDDACLIAAAPELAESLEVCLEYIESIQHENNRYFPAFRRARAALAKAKGEGA